MFDVQEDNSTIRFTRLTVYRSDPRSHCSQVASIGTLHSGWQMTNLFPSELRRDCETHHTYNYFFVRGVWANEK